MTTVLKYINPNEYLQETGAAIAAHLKGGDASVPRNRVSVTQPGAEQGSGLSPQSPGMSREEAERIAPSAEWVRQNSVSCDGCGHVFVDFTALEGGIPHSIAGDPEGEGSACAFCMNADALQRAAQPKREEPDTARLEQDVERYKDLLVNGPRSASCTVAQGHDYNAKGNCYRGCWIPEDGYLHNLQKEIAILREAIDRAREERSCRAGVSGVRGTQATGVSWSMSDG